MPDAQGPNTLGYSTSLFFALERDFGTPDDLRALVQAAHRQGLAVVLDEVFNHTSNDVNPLYKMILEHPDDEADPADGGLYFNGSTPWGNRIATEKEDVQNMLIDACKMYLTEYHVDGFRFDATNTEYMDHGFVLRLADELKKFQAKRLAGGREPAEPAGSEPFRVRRLRPVVRPVSRQDEGHAPRGRLSGQQFLFDGRARKHLLLQPRLVRRAHEQRR